MSNGADAAILDADAARSATDTRRAAIRAAGTGFSVGRMLAVTRKELRSYFAFPLVYVLSGVFLVLAGYYAYTDLVFFVTISKQQTALTRPAGTESVSHGGHGGHGEVKAKPFAA